MILLGLAGKKGSGKNTVASIISSLTQPRITHEIAFADPLKDEVCKALGITRLFLETHKANFRLILQGWGTDYRRKLCDEQYWIKQFLLGLSAIDNTNNPIVIVTDVRFLNEYEVVKRLGGYCIRVTRNNPDKPAIEHISETDLDTVQMRTVTNNSTLEDLEQQVRELLTEMKILK